MGWPKYSEKILSQCHILHGLTLECTQVSMVRGQWKTTKHEIRVNSTSTFISYLTGSTTPLHYKQQLFGSQQGQEILLFYKVSIPALGFTHSYSMGTCVPFRRLKQSGCNVYHSHLSSAEVENAWGCTSNPLPHVSPTALIHIYVNFMCLIHL